MLKILKPGFYSSIQDAGRFGYRHLGVPVSGVMDSFSAQKANKLLGNSQGLAVIEITMTGPEILFDEPTYICLSGAEFDVELNTAPIKNYEVVAISAGDILTFGRLKKGIRACLAIKGGFRVKPSLGSSSQYGSITAKSRLEAGDEISYTTPTNFKPAILEVKINTYLDTSQLEVQKAPEFHRLSKAQKEQLFSTQFHVAKENNRMAYQLEERLEEHTFSMLTSATLPGTVQLTPSGKLLILMRDGQTTGGYPRILQLSEKAICVLAQKRFGDQISFKTPTL